MPFEYKPDFAEARRHWQAFWRHEIVDRPCVRVVAAKDGLQPPPHPPGLHHPDDDLASIVRAYDRWAGAIHFGGDAVPAFFPNFGPDVYAAFLGADLEHSRKDATSWARPFVKDWKTDGARMERPFGFWWDAALEFVSTAREIAGGRFAVAVLDLHSNLDCLAAVRGPEGLCLDLADSLNEVEAVLRRVRATYPVVFNQLYSASGQDQTGCTTWLPMYCEGRYAAIQCDLICMISPEMGRRLVMPALEEEAQFLDHCCYHLDGPDALPHLDDLLAIDAIDAIQWVPGAGNAPMIEWMDLLKRIQKAGKSVYVGTSADELKIYHRELRPELVVYDVYGVGSQSESEALIEWLRRNT